MSNNQRSLAVPNGWADVFVRTVTALLVAFGTLNVKEYMETREWDIVACTIDAGWIAGATFLLCAILTVTSGWARRSEQHPVPASR